MALIQNDALLYSIFSRVSPGTQKGISGKYC